MAEVSINKLHKLQDVEVCDALFRAYMRWLIEELQSVHGILIPPEQEERLHLAFREEWPGMVGGGGGIYLALVGGYPSGICTLKPISDKEVELKRFYVSPGSRGNGLGRQLIELSLNEAKQLGYETVRLETFAFMKSAVKMYKAYGFKEVAPFDGFEGSNQGTGSVELFMQLDF